MTKMLSTFNMSSSLQRTAHYRPHWSETSLAVQGVRLKAASPTKQLGTYSLVKSHLVSGAMTQSLTVQMRDSSLQRLAMTVCRPMLRA